jgi:hypothetical protein
VSAACAAMAIFVRRRSSRSRSSTPGAVPGRRRAINDAHGHAGGDHVLVATGVHVAYAEGSTPESLLLEADRDMYVVKRGSIASV